MANNLLIDVGNTSVKWAMQESNGPLTMSQQRYSRENVKGFFSELWKNEDKPNRIIVSCVANTDVWNAVEQAVLSLWNLKPERIFAKSSGYGLVNAYTSPADLGSDRWCALIGAYHEADSNIVVIDCGSAITIDVANESGEHLGGYLLPGLSMMKQSLGIHTAKVNVASYVEQHDSLNPAKTTSGCVNAAVILAAVSMIDAVIKQQLGNSSNLTCFLTGGDADLIAQHLTAEYVNMPNLVIHGLAYISESEQE